MTEDRGSDETLTPATTGDETLDAPPGSLPTDTDFPGDSNATVLLPVSTASGRDSAGPEPTAASQAGELDERVVEAAIRRGLITAKQATRALVSPAPALQTLIGSGLLSKAQARELEEEVRNDFVPGFKLLGELGRGAMGVVYKGIQTSLDRTVAIKVVTPSQANDPHYVQRFQQEAKALARLNHPNIVQVYDHGESRGRLYIALEFVDGTDCADVLAAQGPFAPADALRVIHDAALGLSHAQAEGIIHRDIKPANLMLVSQGRDASRSGGSVKVTDLGLARLQENQGGGGQITTAGTVLGSPAYMAPEQSQGEPADFRSDIYALGATLFHLLTGKPPFGDQSALKILSMKSTHQLPSPSDEVEGIAADVVLVLDRMLAKPPAARYQSYAELLEDLEAVLASRSPRTPPVPRADSSLLPPRQVPRTRRLNEAEGEPAAAVVAPALAQPGLDVANPAHQPPSAWPRVLALVLVLAATGAGVWSVTRDQAPSPGPTVAPSPSPSDPAQTVATTLEALERGSDHALLHAGEILPQLQAQIAELPLGQRPALQLRFEQRVRAALEALGPELEAELETAHQARRYDDLLRAADELLALFALVGGEAPATAPRYAELAAQGQGPAGERERAVWEEASAASDPLRVLALLEGFSERFPFSPALAQAEQALREAEREAPQVSLVPEPAAASLTLDGQALGAGRWEGRLRRGAHPLRVEAAGYDPLETTLQVEGPESFPLRLGPRPRRALRQGTASRPVWNPNSSKPITAIWDLSGPWVAAPEQAGLRGESPRSGSWARANRDVSSYLAALTADAAGWQLQWMLTPPPAGRAEIQLLAAADGRRVVAGVEPGRAYLGVRADERLDVHASLTFSEPPGFYRLDWDGDVVVFHARDQAVGSLRPGWVPAQPGVISLAVLDTQATFRELKLYALEPAGD